MTAPNFKQLANDGQVVNAVKKLTEQGMSSSEIVQKGYLGLPYEIVDSIRSKYLREKHKASQPPPEPEEKPKGGRFEIKERE